MRFVPVIAALLVTTSSCAAIIGLSPYEVVGSEAVDAGGASGEEDVVNGNPPESGAEDSSNGIDVLAGDAADADGAPPKPPLCDPNDTSLVLCLPFDGNGADLGGSATVLSSVNLTFKPGRVNQAGVFDGVTSEVTFAAGASPKFDAMTTGTLEAFVTPDVLPATGLRAGIMDSDNKLGLFLINDTFECVNPAVLGKPLTIGKTTHIACTRDGTTIVAYQDGVAVANGPSPTIPVTASRLAIGRNDPSGEYFKGTIDELRIYSRARTPTEIAADAKR